jgi:hypothetical protein
MVPTSSQRTRSAAKTGPSTQDRVIRVMPSFPTTGSTQVMHTPIPQAIDSSTATWQGNPYDDATAPTARSIGIGPHAYTASAPVRSSSSGSTSTTVPRVPAEPSSVVTVTAPAVRFASSSPKSRSAVPAPIRKSTRHSRARSAPARPKSGAEPYPPPTSRQPTGEPGSGNGVPSGPTRSSCWPGRTPASHSVPRPCTPTTNWTVPE